MIDQGRNMIDACLQLMRSKDQINRTLLDSQLQEQLKMSKTLKESTISRFDHDEFSIMNKATSQQLFVFEFAAVFLFTYGYECSVSVFEMDAQAAGVLLMSIFLSGMLCGANINPVITLSNYLKKESKYKARLLPCYFLAQFFGAVAGLFWSDVLGHKRLDPLELSGGGDIFKVISNQTMGVFILVLFTLLLSNPNTSFIDSELSGYLSIAIFYHIARSFAPLAGLVINPAFTLALAIQHAVWGEWGSLENCWAWLVGDIFGCLLATLFYTYIYEPIIKEIREIKRKSENFESLTEESDAYA